MVASVIKGEKSASCTLQRFSDKNTTDHYICEKVKTWIEIAIVQVQQYDLCHSAKFGPNEHWEKLLKAPNST